MMMVCLIIWVMNIVVFTPHDEHSHRSGKGTIIYIWKRFSVTLQTFNARLITQAYLVIFDNGGGNLERDVSSARANVSEINNEVSSARFFVYRHQHAEKNCA